MIARFIRYAAFLIAVLAAACASRSGAPPPTPGDCATIRLWSNGWHVNLAMRAELFDRDHVVRRLFPEARYFLIGWGERNFYTSKKPGVWKGLKAVIPPSPAAIQAIAGKTPVEDTIWPGRDIVTLAISDSAARELALTIGKWIVKDESGDPIILQQGRVAGKSVFLAARGNFHFFNMCNHWTAKRLRQAGVPVRARISFTADGLMRAVKRKTDRACPTPSD